MLVGGAVSLDAKEPIGQTLDSISLAILSFVMVCWGAFLFCYGIQAFRAASFGLGLMVFMVNGKERAGADAAELPHNIIVIGRRFF